MSLRIAYRGWTVGCCLALVVLTTELTPVRVQAREARRAAVGWRLLYSEDFEALTLPAPAWAPDRFPDDGGIYTEAGAFFRRQGILPPPAFRAAAPFGQSDWLTLESYTRPRTDSPAVPSARIEDLTSVVPDPDPANPGNRVLRIASVQHTDGTIIRPTRALPNNYRISLRVGYPDFGDGEPAGLNGYDSGDERGDPWRPVSAVQENGFYWLAIWDKETRPHNNLDAHHHRKVVIDSDNNQRAWTDRWDASRRRWVPDGRHPVMMFALNRNRREDPVTGLPPISFTRRRWDTSGSFRTIDSYLDRKWYRVSIARLGNAYTLSVEGEFRWGGRQQYTGTISGSRVFHFNGFPDYFVFGDPHINFYEGEVFYDDVTLEQWGNS